MPSYKSKEKTKDGRIWYFKTYYTDIDGIRKTYKSKKYMTKKIFEKAGYRELLALCFNRSSHAISKPFVTSGLKLSKYIIHVLTPYLNASNCSFEEDIYASYHEIFKLIIKNGFSNVVFTPLTYSYKRVGNKYSLRTCYFFIRYFMLLYNYTTYNKIHNK